MKSSVLEALQRERRGLEATPTDKEVKERLNRLKGKSCPFLRTTPPFFILGRGERPLADNCLALCLIIEVKRQKLLIGIADVPSGHASSSGGAFSYPRDNRSSTFLHQC
jgi:hypothetical protein